MNKKTGNQGRRFTANKVMIRKWKETAVNLLHKGQLTVMLGEGLNTMLAGLDDKKEADIQEVEKQLSTLVDNTLKAISETTTQEPQAEESTPTVKRTNPSYRSVQMLEKADLCNRQFPAVFLGSRQVEHEWLSLAVGIDPEGYRSILGLWQGAISSSSVCDRVLADLDERRLSTREGLLMVIAGSTVLARKAEEIWQKRVLTAPCHYTLKKTLLSHLPPEKADTIKGRLRAVLSQQNPGEGELSGLLRVLEEYPGAQTVLQKNSARVFRVNRLPISKALFEQLRTAGAVRMAFKKATAQTRGDERPRRRILSGLEKLTVRRVKGYRSLSALIAELKKNEPVTPPARKECNN